MPYLQVGDTREALGRLGERYRDAFTLPVCAVAGSNGKTTTKELLAAVLTERFEVLKSPASYNNDIGVPLTLLRLEKGHEAAVLEIGTNHPGEVAERVRQAKPSIGVLTQIGREHLEFFGEIDRVADEQGALAEGLPADGLLVIHGDDPWSESIGRRCPARVVRVGSQAHHDWRVVGIRPDADGSTLEVRTTQPAFSGRYRIPLLGRHQAINALLALAVGYELGLTPSELSEGLMRCPGAPGRLQVRRVDGIQILDDCYNANADSMLAALQTLRELPCRGRRIAVLGDMAELGDYAEEAHGEVGRRVGELGIDCLIAVGGMAAVYAVAARQAGLAEVVEQDSVESASKALKDAVGPDDVVLLKASRAMRLERITALAWPEEGSR